ncbi:unnamed protein product [Protopolystoma xenopodis]|uniref:Uncharacterized protein n=1 Tax=Protopolystoma xenopodis TaxID=117903 RepID=A0A3S5BUD8_9PLAT|nr:unnamed protein product [Protopolystoma xenopodis]
MAPVGVPSCLVVAREGPFNPAFVPTFVGALRLRARAQLRSGQRQPEEKDFQFSRGTSPAHRALHSLGRPKASVLNMLQSRLP